MATIARSLTELIGHTPLLELTRIEQEQSLKARVLVKIESLNSVRSVKDRVAYALITEAENNGLIDENTTIIEPTSGNAGVPMGCFFLTLSLMTGIGAPVAIMGIILPVYTIIDMIETAENVWSDSCVAAMTDHDIKK